MFLRRRDNVFDENWSLSTTKFFLFQQCLKDKIIYRPSMIVLKFYKKIFLLAQCSFSFSTESFHAKFFNSLILSFHELVTINCILN